MHLGKIGHATLFISAGDVQCLMDPVFEQPFAGGGSFDPAVDIDARALCASCNLVVVSHSHPDHFSPRSLALIDRSTPILYPEGDPMIRAALSALGFRRPLPVRAGLKLAFGRTTLYPTRSAVDFPEIGMLFCADGLTCWNAVDSIIDDIAVSLVRDAVGRPDVMVAPYQPTLIEPVRQDALGASFPHHEYGRLLRSVFAAAPRAVVPGASGFAYVQEWYNARAYPMTEQQFARDLKRVTPALEVRLVPHGGGLDVATLQVEPEGQPHVRRTGRRLFPSVDWRPEAGVPPMRDPGERPDPSLEARVAAFLDGRFLEQLAATEPAWLEKVARLETLWHLEVALPGGGSLHRHLRFDGGPLRWCRASEDDFVTLRTVANATAIAAALDARITAFGLAQQLRRTSRLYSVHRAGAACEDEAVDEPLGRVLYLLLDERYFDRETQEALELEAAPTQARSRAVASVRR